ncbi:hypothetical protein [Novosphingobium sp. CF614]|uniref:hypothetical protein n=1 Tax=Novosphingobium sp. CF614 TaxID=1884364 RepID=UPI00116027BC|nr:hypothetical protein [Novosphingobium sp. CF614]
MIYPAEWTIRSRAADGHNPGFSAKTCLSGCADKDDIASNREFGHFQSMIVKLETVAALLCGVVAAATLGLAFNAAHFSFWEFILPGAEPWTWLAPLALFGAPLLLVASRAVSGSLARGLTWLALVLLTLPVLGVLALIIFPKQTGYYDPDRQPGGVPWEQHGE